ncbi:glycoside hydrolase family 105 protein [Evansella sp. AB-rgal1]|uniref:beta-galactosidase BglB n=1 Tax=Evansella sp. AB-rgal1 TaxID=3242696 RepID=UPI00359DCE88
MVSENMDKIIHNVIDQMKNLEAPFEENEVPIPHISMEHWEWPQGVGLFGLYLYYKKSGNKEIFNYLEGWFERRFQEGLPGKNVNTMCPMLTLTYLYEETENEHYLDLCKEWLDYVMNDMPRTQENGIQHIVTAMENREQLWDDTLYMTVLFVTRMGVLLKDDKYIQESIYQFLIHLKYLTDRKTGLLFHGWTFEGNHHFAGALWARGNSWYTAGIVDYLEIVELPPSMKEILLSALEMQVKTLEKLQNRNGMWHTLLDDSSTYVEASATAAFSYGILKAVRKGFLPEKYKETGVKAWKAVMERIDEKGILLDVSYGTGMGSDLQYYKDIKVCPMPYGQSMALLMMVEGLEHGLTIETVK